MTKQEKIQLTVPLKEVLELLRLVTQIEMPDVTYHDDMLLMAQQAIRLSKRYASNASDILYRWTREEKPNDN